MSAAFAQTSARTALRLSASQISSYKTYGFLVVRVAEHNIVTPVKLKSWTEEVFQWPRSSAGRWLCYEEEVAQGSRQLMRTERFADYHDGFRALLFGDRLRSILGQLAGEEMILFKDKINYKLGGGNGFKAHTDAPAYDHIAKIDHITANFAVAEATVENGCLEVAPGSHKQQVEFAHGGRVTDVWEASQQWTRLPLSPGDVVFFGSHLAHRSAPNKTPDKRSSVYATYHRAAQGRDLREQYYADRMRNFPPDHEREAGRDYSKGMERYGFHYFGNKAITAAT